MKFQLLTIVRLVSPDLPVPDTDDDDRIQASHISYLTGLRERGVILLNGPVRRLDDPKFRGMSIYAVGHEEARSLAMEDPAVKAGWFEVIVDPWLLPAIPVTLGDRVDLEL